MGMLRHGLKSKLNWGHPLYVLCRVSVPSRLAYNEWLALPSNCMVFIKYSKKKTNRSRERTTYGEWYGETEKSRNTCCRDKHNTGFFLCVCVGGGAIGPPPPLRLSANLFCLLICPGPCNNLDPLLKFLYETPPSECTNPPFWILDPRLTWEGREMCHAEMERQKDRKRRVRDREKEIEDAESRGDSNIYQIQ